MKDMLRKSGLALLAGLLILASCKDSSVADGKKLAQKGDKAFSHNEGVTLMIEDADLMQIDSNPHYNTAEWHFKVNEPGRYDIWLSSLTCDTSHLKFTGEVTITAGDTRIEKRPVGDEIITNDKSITSPWFRADSHMGSVFFSAPGEYQVQVISDRVVPHTSNLSKLSVKEHTLINSLILKPSVN